MACNVRRAVNFRKVRWLNSGVKGFFGQVLNALQTVSEYSEYTTRIGTYKLSKDALAAKNNSKATLDDMKTAAIQGYDRTYRTFNPAKLKTKDGRKELFGAITRLALLSIFALNHDEDLWRNLPDFQKEKN